MATSKKSPAKARKPAKAPAKRPARTTSIAKEAQALKRAVERQAEKPRKTGRRTGDDAIDWEAVERDYRTGRFTDTELATKHGCSRQSILRRREKDKAAGHPWAKDLSQAVREATRAALVEETVQEGVRNVTDAVLIAAEVNKAVILQHRSDLKAMRDQCFALLAELQAANGTMEELRGVLETLEEFETSAIEGDPDLSERDKDTRLKRLSKKFDAIRKAAFETADIHNRVGSAQKLMALLKEAQTMERKAFNLDDDPDGKKAAGGYESVLDKVGLD